MKKVNWDDVEEMQGFDNPKPGAYIAVITAVEDVEEKEYLKIEWDFAEGSYKGNNRETFERAKFWPTPILRSYKDTALGFFKAFKTALEKSNRGYVFDYQNPRGMVGCKIGVVLGEEGYTKKNGNPGKRLYVSATHSIEAIVKGDFTVPEFRQAKSKNGERINSNSYSAWSSAQTQSEFADLTDDDGELPF